MSARDLGEVWPLWALVVALVTGVLLGWDWLLWAVIGTLIGAGLAWPSLRGPRVQQLLDVYDAETELDRATRKPT